jgi:hypothetical protein
MCWTLLCAKKHKSDETQNVKTHKRTIQKTNEMSHQNNWGRSQELPKGK